jgi:predicted lipid-binding transport protein (Tim44 family)
MNIVKAVSVVLASAALLAVSIPADAKRLGGGKNTGKQTNSIQRDSTPASPAATPAAGTAAQQTGAASAMAAKPAAAAAATSTRSKWMGPIAGLAAGLGLAALASHFGFGEALANGLMIALLVMVVLGVIGFIMAKRRAAQNGAMRPAYAGNAGNTSVPSAFTPASQETPNMQRTGFSGIGSGLGGVGGAAGAAGAFTGTNPSATPDVPAGFEVESFLRNAKVYFLRLQAANDARNLNDIQEFTTPEMYGELAMDINERTGTQRTDVTDLVASFMGIERHATQFVAGVKYTGKVSEAGEAPQPFTEAWVLVKPLDGGGWLLAGIEQLN